MKFALVLVVAIALAWLLRKQLKSHPMLFYGMAVALNICYLACMFVGAPAILKDVMFLLMQKCTLALALFVVVMFIGAFKKDSAVSIGLRPVRSELSILACILTLGHMVAYLMSFLPRLARGAMDGTLAFFFTTAVVLLVLLLILGVTSFAEVKRRMDAATWKKIQRWAYVFFGLAYVHLASILLPSALRGATTAGVSIGVYTVLFGAYAAMRIYRAWSDKKEQEA